MSAAPLRLGTRRSPMAMTQSRLVAEAVTRLTGREIELVGITTHGDANQAHVTQIGGTGVFVSALRTALLAGEVDFAVHSLKDLPTGEAEGIVLAAVPARDDPRDALCAAHGAKLADLPRGARVGTGAPRRAAQLLLLRADLRPVPVRGNADTRLAKLESEGLDAVVLGHAGLARIGRLADVTQVFEPDEMLPAAGQGALAVECSSSREDLVALLACVDDAPSRAATTAERVMLGALEAGCTAPVGAYAAGTEVLRLRGLVVSADGGMALRGSASGPPAMAAAIGQQVAGELLSRGAGRYTAVPDLGPLGRADSGGHISSGDDDK
jgi:hydroxymethylbilane synthase